MDVKDLCITRETKIKDVIKRLDDTAKKILFILHDNALAGVVTDGDIRRYILRSGDLNDKVETIMNSNPICVMRGEESKAKAIMKEKYIEAIPVLNKEREVLKVLFWKDFFVTESRQQEVIDVPVVIMAGGKGTRLEPLTNVFPKPLVPIGDIPIVERVIGEFLKYGCNNFYLTINYKKNLIKAYFNELDKDYEIEFVEEDKPLGTGGSLYLLKEKIKESFFVSNCDILIHDNYYKMLHHHRENNNKITLIASVKFLTIPYGIIDLNEEGLISELIEKPEYNYLVNTGMYLLEPEALKDIPENEFFHITDLIKIYIEKGERVGIYPISEESWLDMGQINEMDHMLKRLGLQP